MDRNLSEYKSYIDEEMLKILGQMDTASQIFEYLYLGSEWNASNLEELKLKGLVQPLFAREFNLVFFLLQSRKDSERDT